MLMNNEQKDRIYACHPAIVGLLVDLLILLVPLSVLHALALLLGVSVLPEGLQQPTIFVAAYRIACAVLVLEMIRRYFDQVLILGRRRIIYFKGILSLHCTKVSVRYSDIRELHVTQSILGRILHYGDISIGTAAKGEYEIIAFGLASPERLALIIDDLRKFGDDERLQDQNSPPAAAEHISPARKRRRFRRFRNIESEEQAPQHALD